MHIVWLPQAVQQRFQQLDHVAEDRPLAAADQDDAIERQMVQLLDHPKLGRPGRVKGTRELVIGGTPFIVVYRIQGVQRIEVLAFLHGAQRWPWRRS